MKKCILTVTFFLTLAFFVSAQSINPETRITKNKSGSDKRVKKEILNLEGQFKRAVSRHDAITLDSLLADVYAISFVGGETAIPRKRAMEGYLQGRFSYHDIYNAKVFIFGDTVQITGDTTDQPDSTDRGEGSSKSISQKSNEENKSLITRWWAKREGRWKLTAEELPEVRKERKPY